VTGCSQGHDLASIISYLSLSSVVHQHEHIIARSIEIEEGMYAK
jgi:hypothetical protein